MVALLSLLACKPDAEPVAPLDLAEGCQPLLAGNDCLAPYPTDFFRVANAASPSGFSDVIPEGAQTLTRDDVVADVAVWRPPDGASRYPFILASLNVEASDDGFVGISDRPEDSLAAATSHTLILAPDGTAIPHWVDFDPIFEYPNHQAITLHPLVRLDAETRYVVAFTGATDPAGDVIPAPEGFRRVRDAANDASLADLLARYETEVFPVIEGAGVAREDLQLAWSFTTGTDAFVQDDMLTMRQTALDAMAATPPTVTITSVDERDDAHVWRIVKGTVSVPMFLDSDRPGGRLLRDADGKVRQDGNVDVPFTVVIPQAARGVGPVPVVGVGHGFFYNLAAVEGEVDLLEQIPAVGVAVDWWGMTDADRNSIVLAMLNETSATMAFADRVEQAQVNWIGLTHALGGALAAEESVKDNGVLVYDPERVGFYGLSMGHILGGSQVALNPDIDRGVLIIGGGGLSHLLFRSQPFFQFILVMANLFDDPYQRQKFVAQMARELDRIDPLTYADYVLASPLDGDPTEILMQTGLGDQAVPNLASWFHARALGLGTTSPTPFEPWGVPTAATDATSAQTIVDWGYDTSFYDVAEAPLDDNGVHGKTLGNSSLKTEAAAFLRDGSIVHPCDGPCDPH